MYPTWVDYYANKIDQAISIAIKAHAGQVDKGGRPYILHPLRLMTKFKIESEMIVAVLHDVIEDSFVTMRDLSYIGFTVSIKEAIVCLTRVKGESYDDFILRISKNDLARRVKIEDIKDNMDLSRLKKITPKDLARLEKYRKALEKLTGE